MDMQNGVVTEVESDEMTDLQHDDAADLSAWLEEQIQTLHKQAIALLAREQLFLNVLTGDATQSEFKAAFQECRGKTWESYTLEMKERLETHIDELRAHGRGVSPDLIEQLATRISG
jgi:L-lactate utilization protein LutC